MKTSNPIPYLPEKFRHLIDWMKKQKMPSKIIFFALGIISTVWFLIRVIPKPSRAAYPCMQATAPYMSAFVLWLIGLTGGAFSLVQFRKTIYEAKYLLAFVFLLMMTSFYIITEIASPQTSNANQLNTIQGDFPPNDPIGIAQGIFPGRVVWSWDPEATNENCDNTSNGNGFMDEADNAWFQEHNNNIQVIDSMLTESLLLLSGTNQIEDAWDEIFRFYNIKSGTGDIGYTNGEIVLLKLNSTSAYGIIGNHYYEDLSRNDIISVNPFAAETNPYLVLALLRHLVESAGVPEEMIYIGDPARNIYKEFYDLWHNEYPNVNYLGNNLIHPELDVLALGRTPVAITEDDKVFYSDNSEVMPDAGSDKLFTIFEELDYLINIPTLKAHSIAGITLAAKNHFGSFTRDWAMHLHDGLMVDADDPQRLGYELYRIQTDIMMHDLLSGKNLLMIVDGLYPGEDALGVPEKWESTPFDNDWCSSLFVSLDPVAIESVCHDFLRAEYHGPTVAESRPNWDGVDDYLHQAADSSWWPDGIIYDPDNDGVIITTLGVHEHWNDSINKEYSRNLGVGEGIELIKAHETNVGLNEAQESLNIHIYPNPTSDFVVLENRNQKTLEIQLISSQGSIISNSRIERNSQIMLDLKQYPSGIYFINISDGNNNKIEKIIKQ